MSTMLIDKGAENTFDLAGATFFVCCCFHFIKSIGFYKMKSGAQWLSGRVLDSRPRGRGFEPHRRHCVVVLSKAHIS